jgi:hypothetical protein
MLPVMLHKAMYQSVHSSGLMGTSDFCADTVGSSTLYGLSDDDSDCNCSTITPVLSTSSGHYRERHVPGLVPTPSADAVMEQLNWGFVLHAYGFASFFLILAFYAFFSILNLR